MLLEVADVAGVEPERVGPAAEEGHPLAECQQQSRQHQEADEDEQADPHLVTFLLHIKSRVVVSGRKPLQ
jgi:hypothetical protein